MDPSLARRLYRVMYTIRRFEETAAEESRAGRMPGFMHLYIGQEAVAAGVCAQLREDDWITSTHRGHGHCIAKGVDIKYMMAELYARETGVSKGKGGSMHMIDFSKGILGANGIVGAGLPLACGAALTARVKGTDQVCVGFMGDGATNTGAFHESLNLSAVWKLPVIWVVENNRYGEATPLEAVTKVTQLSLRAQAYGMAGVTVDGQDVVAVYEAAGEAVARARAGEGPTLLECVTYRYTGHFVGDPDTYRSPEEVAEYRARDCLERFRQRATAEGWLTAKELKEEEDQVEAAIEEALRFAADGPLPYDVLSDVYVSLP